MSTRQLREYARLVEQMREKQREFFDPKRRRPSTIGESKGLEKLVDRETAAILDDTGQGDLFGAAS